MKKLFVLILVVCLLGSAAMAEETVPELNWSDFQEKYENLGSFQQIEIPDSVTMKYWIPQNMAAFDVSLIQADIPPVAAFATADGEYTAAVSVLDITSLEDYAVSLENNGTGNFRNLILNGFDAIGAENEADGIDILIIPVTDTQVLVYYFTPLNGDDGWDSTKTVIVASIQVVE